MKTLSASVVLSLALWSETPLAQPAQLPMYVSTHLPTACQGATDFSQRLLSRTNRLRWANPGEPGVTFDVVVQLFPTGLLGQLQIRELSGRFTQRTVEGGNCDGVLDALAFVSAVLVDSEPQPEPTPPQAPLRDLGATSWPPPAPPQSFGTFTHYHLAFGVTAGLTSGTATTFAQPNLGLRLSLAWTNPYFAPWVMVGFEQRLDSTTHSSFGAASVDTTFGGWAAHLAMSPLRWPAKGHYILRPVAVFEVGQLTSNTTRAANVTTVPPSTSRPWVASGLGASAEASLSGPLAAVADLSVLVPWYHLDYYYLVGTTDSAVFKVPGVGFSLRVGLILKFE